MDRDLEWMDLESGGMPVSLIQFLMNSKQFHTELQQISSLSMVKACGVQTGIGADLLQFHWELFWFNWEIIWITWNSPWQRFHTLRINNHSLTIFSPPNIKVLGVQRWMGVDLSQFHLELFGLLWEKIWNILTTTFPRFHILRIKIHSFIVCSLPNIKAEQVKAVIRVDIAEFHLELFRFHQELL